MLPRTAEEAEASASFMASLIDEIEQLPEDHPLIEAVARHIEEHGEYRYYTYGHGMFLRWAIRTDFEISWGGDRLANFAEAVRRDFHPKPPRPENLDERMQALINRVAASRRHSPSLQPGEVAP